MKTENFKTEIIKLTKDSYMDWQIFVYNKNNYRIEDCQILGTKKDAEHELESILRYLKTK